MNTPARISTSIAFAFLLAACSGGGMPGSVRTVSVAHGTRHAPQEFTSGNSRYFDGAQPQGNRVASDRRIRPAQQRWQSQAGSHGNRIANGLRTAIANEIIDSDRFDYRSSGADAEIAINHLRHGLIEVADGLYAVNVSGDVTIHRADWRHGRSRRTTDSGLNARDFSGTSGIIRPLAEFENAANYDEAARAAVEKIAVEIVAGL
jgi:hypothetical protein